MTTAPRIWHHGRSELRNLSQSTCLELLLTRETGRLAYLTPSGPRIVPMNYGLDQDSIWFTTGARSELASSGLDQEAAFQVDRIDESRGSGWSVLVVGPLTEFRGSLAPADQGRLPDAWPARTHELVIRMTWTAVTGRQLLPAL